MMFEADRNKTNHYHPCIKYKIPADPESDGTNNFIVAESMKVDFKKFNIQLWNRHSLSEINEAFGKYLTIMIPH